MPWYSVCTKAIFISKGSFRDVEHKNFILGSVQKGYKPLRWFKLPAFMYRHIAPTMQISETSGLLIAMYRVCTKAIFISKRSFKDAEPKNNILWLVQKGYKPQLGFKIPAFMYRHRGRQCKFPKFRGFLSPWYRVCTKAIFSSNGSFRDAEPKNFILGLVQIGYKPLRGFKVPAFMCRDIGPRMQVYEISGLPIAMYRACTKTIFISIGMQSSRILSLGWCK